MVAGRPYVRHAHWRAAFHCREPQEDDRENPEGQAEPAALSDGRRARSGQEAAQGRLTGHAAYLNVTAADYSALSYFL